MNVPSALFPLSSPSCSPFLAASSPRRTSRLLPIFTRSLLSLKPLLLPTRASPLRAAGRSGCGDGRWGDNGGAPPLPWPRTAVRGKGRCRSPPSARESETDEEAEQSVMPSTQSSPAKVWILLPIPSWRRLDPPPSSLPWRHTDLPHLPHRQSEEEEWQQPDAPRPCRVVAQMRPPRALRCPSRPSTAGEGGEDWMPADLEEEAETRTSPSY